MTATQPKPAVRVLRLATFRSLDMSVASLELRTNSSRWTVARYLPAGEDIGPDHWHWPDEPSAQVHFDCLVDWFRCRGYVMDNPFPKGRW